MVIITNRLYNELKVWYDDSRLNAPSKQLVTLSLLECGIERKKISHGPDDDGVQA